MSAEEIANSLTHGVGLLLSVAGLVVLIVVAALHGGAVNVVSCAIYGATLVCLYAASTIYHGVPSPRWRRALKTLDHCAIYLLIWRRALKTLDHCAIYLLIAGTYTPFTLVSMRGGWGWTLFGIVWGLAIAGILLKLWFVDHFAIASTIVYLAMGWLVVIAAKPILSSVPRTELIWLAAGGLLYTSGVVFFAWQRLRFSHAIWHLFVMGGSACHYVAVLYYVAPSPA